VILTQHGKAAVVLVSPDLWNRLIERLEMLDDSVEALQAEIELLTGRDEVISWGEAKAELDAVPA